MRNQAKTPEASAYAKAHNIPKYWAGKPSMGMRKIYMIGSTLAGLAIIATALLNPIVSRSAIMFGGIAIIFVPILIMMDWRHSEYLLGPTHVIMRNGVLEREVTGKKIQDFNFIRTNYHFFGYRLGLANIEMGTVVEDKSSQDGLRFLEKPTVVRDIPAEVAQAIVAQYAKLIDEEELTPEMCKQSIQEFKEEMDY